MSAWIPSDDQLDVLARGLPPLVPAAQRSEQTRTSLLASTAPAAQQSRRSGKVIVAALALPLAAAAAIAIWIGTRPAAMPIRDTVISHGSVKFEVASDWPDRIVRLDDGSLDVDLHALAVDERFRVRAPDGELESRDARFTVDVRADRIAAVAVSRGQLEVRVVGSAPVIIAAGQSWSAPTTAHRDAIVPTRDVPTPTNPSTPTEPQPIDPKAGPTPPRPVVAKRPSEQRPREPKMNPSITIPTEPLPRATPSPPTPSPATPSPATPSSATLRPSAPATQPPPLSPGEAEFRAGMIAWRNGDPGAAAASFATACTTAQSALAEDACFWVGAAARRANQVVVARDALGRFLQRFPSSSRAGEAAALLGWILFEAGDLDGAGRRFKQAANDRVPKVRESATRGIAAIDRTRGR